MIELCSEYLSVRCIWLYVLVISRTRFRVNPHSTSGCGFESSCSHLNFRFRASFELGVPWHSGNYRVWIHSEVRTWHDKNIQSLFKMTIYLAIWFIFMDHLQNKAVAEVLDNWQCLEYVSQLLFTLHLLLFRFYP